MGGLYNMVIGVGPLAGDLLAMLKLTLEGLGRFRDAYLVDGDDGLLINVHTRCGGGNRVDYEEVFKAVRRHPHYVRDQDCDYDSTYADIVFKVPEKFQEALDSVVQLAEKEGIRGRVVDNRTQTEKWEQAMEAISSKAPAGQELAVAGTKRAGLEPGDRVGAIYGGNEKKVEIFGFGVYEGEFVYGDEPDAPAGWMADGMRDLPEEQRCPNPRIRLDSGEVVWGCECWWGGEEKVKARIDGWREKGAEVTEVSIDEVRANVRAEEAGDERQN